MTEGDIGNDREFGGLWHFLQEANGFPITNVGNDRGGRDLWRFPRDVKAGFPESPLSSGEGQGEGD